MLSQPHGGLALLLALLSLTTPAHAINGRPDSEASSECALSGVDNSNYTLSLHIVAIFVVFASSGIGITLPFITKLSSRRPSTAASTASGWRAWLTWHEVFFVSKYFGAGVILATAFVHLTYEAFIQLSSPCINLAFQPTAPAISMASMFLIFLVDFLLMRHIHRSRAAMEKVKAMRAKTRTATESITLNTIQQTDSLTARAPVPAPEKLDTNTPTPTATAEAEAEANRAMLQEEEDRIAEAKLAERAKELDVMVIEGGIVYVPVPLLPCDQTDPSFCFRRLFFYSFHSVMVGLGLGTSSDAGFIPYFIAIVFHQMFDGFAIGTRMVELDFTNKRRKQTIMFRTFAPHSRCIKAPNTKTDQCDLLAVHCCSRVRLRDAHRHCVGHGRAVDVRAQRPRDDPRDWNPRLHVGRRAALRSTGRSAGQGVPVWPDARCE